MSESTATPENYSKRSSDAVIQVLAHDMTRMREDVTEIKGSFVKMAEALNKLVVVEERQANLSAANDRAFGEIAKLQAATAIERQRHDERESVAIEKVASSIERLHTRIDDQGRETREDIDRLTDRLGSVEQTIPETNRVKEWFFEGVKYLAVVGISYYISKGGL